MANIISPYNWNIPVEYDNEWYTDFVSLIQAIADDMSVIYNGEWPLTVKVSSDPDTAGWGATEASRMWFNTTDKKFKGWNGEEIVLLG